MTQPHECPDCLWGVGREPLDLESIALHLAKISPGPWRLEYDNEGAEMRVSEHWPYRMYGPQNVFENIEGVDEIVHLQDADAEFMAHSPEYVRYLLDVIDHLHAQNIS